MNIKKGWIILAVVAVVCSAVLAVRFLSGEDTWICKNGEWIKHGNPKAEKPVKGCGENSNNQVEEQQTAEEPNIVVFNPKENAKISSPFDIEGKARVFENTVSIRLKDKNGKILYEGITTAQSPDMGKFGLFQEEITYTATQSEGILEIFESSAKDGSEINKVIILVKFKDEESK